MKKFRISTTITLSSTSYSLAQGTNNPGVLKLKKDTSLTNRFLLRRRDRNMEMLDQPVKKRFQQPGSFSTTCMQTDAAQTQDTAIPPFTEKNTGGHSLPTDATGPGIPVGSAQNSNPSDEQAKAVNKVRWNRCFHLPLRQRSSLPAGNSLISQKQWWKTPRTFTLAVTGNTDWM